MRAAIYCRISDDREGEALGVKRQEDDCRELAERSGAESVQVFIDNDRGASTRSRKPRPAYADMIERARAGEFDCLVAYSNSRLTRRLLEFEALIQLHERAGVRILTVVSGQDDLSTADGRMVARIKASVDAAEAERTGERVARVHLENAKQGKPVGGTRPFGWEADRITVKENEAQHIRAAARWLIDGLPLRGLVEDWSQREIRSVRGAMWRAQTIRQMVTSPRLAGYRVHRGQMFVGSDGKPVRGLHEPVLDQHTWEQVCAVFDRPDQRSRVPRRGRRVYLLTGLVRCGICSAVMYGNRTTTKSASGVEQHYYQCNNPAWSERHSLGVSGNGVDDLISEAVFEAMLDADIEAPAVEEWSREIELAEVGEQIAELMTAFRERRLSGAVVFPAVEALEADQTGMQNDRAQWLADATGPVVQRLESREDWDAQSVDEKRAVIERWLDAVLISPATQRGNRLDPARVQPVWREKQRAPHVVAG